MLKQLSITNYILIEDIKINFNEGLTIITGETGAGKSILLGALRLIMGERAEVKSLRIPENKCVVEAVFDISKLELQTFFEDNELDYDDETIIRREILPNGKSRIFVNDSPVTLNIVQELSYQLIDIHSQFSNAQLKDSNFHLQIVDALIENKSILVDYKEKYLLFKKLEKKLAQLETEFSTNNQISDYNLFLLEELKSANLVLGEKEELENEQKLLSNATEILSSTDKSVFLLENDQVGIINMLNEILQLLNKNANDSIKINEFKERIQSVSIELKDVLNELNRFSADFELNPAKLEEINTRLATIFQLQTKHKVSTVEELINIQNQLAKSTQNFEEIELEIKHLKIEIDQRHNELLNLANQITNQRKAVVPTIEQELEKSLKRMGIENAHFSLSIENQELTTTGFDKVKLFFSANKGSKLEPIEKVASGGEISRISLAIKKLIASHFQLPSLVLDEIDTGISGKTAHQMGGIMQEMAKNMQLFTITHSPQIAAKGSTHFKVFKQTENELTKTYIKELNQEQKLTEIAQLISGNEITASALAQAKELVEK